jgi:hypothetical protein
MHNTERLLLEARGYTAAEVDVKLEARAAEVDAKLSRTTPSGPVTSLRPVLPKVHAFLAEYKALCRRHGLYIGKTDVSGGSIDADYRLAICALDHQTDFERSVCEALQHAPRMDEDEAELAELARLRAKYPHR